MITSEDTLLILQRHWPTPEEPQSVEIEIHVTNPKHADDGFAYDVKVSLVDLSFRVIGGTIDLPPDKRTEAEVRVLEKVVELLGEMLATEQHRAQRTRR